MPSLCFGVMFWSRISLEPNTSEEKRGARASSDPAEIDAKQNLSFLRYTVKAERWSAPGEVQHYWVRISVKQRNGINNAVEKEVVPKCN